MGLEGLECGGGRVMSDLPHFVDEGKAEKGQLGLEHNPPPFASSSPSHVLTQSRARRSVQDTAGGNCRLHGTI